MTLEAKRYTIVPVYHSKFALSIYRDAFAAFVFRAHVIVKKPKPVKVEIRKGK